MKGCVKLKKIKHRWILVIIDFFVFWISSLASQSILVHYKITEESGLYSLVLFLFTLTPFLGIFWFFGFWIRNKHPRIGKAIQILTFAIFLFLGIMYAILVFSSPWLVIGG